MRKHIIREYHTSISEEDFKAVYSVLCDGLPEMEHRTFDEQKHLFQDSRYHVYTVEQEGVVLAMLAFWRLQNFTYVEHLSVLTRYRNSGIGTSLIQKLQKEESHLVFEVEPPDDQVARRRIQLYERMGFHLYPEFPYKQLPLQAGFPELPLMLMTSHDNETVQTLTAYRDELYEVIYHQKRNMLC